MCPVAYWGIFAGGLGAAATGVGTAVSGPAGVGTAVAATAGTGVAVCPAEVWVGRIQPKKSGLDPTLDSGRTCPEINTLSLPNAMT